jgi:hypothetical protein
MILHYLFQMRPIVLILIGFRFSRDVKGLRVGYVGGYVSNHFHWKYNYEPIIITKLSINLPQSYPFELQWDWLIREMAQALLKRGGSHSWSIAV